MKNESMIDLKKQSKSGTPWLLLSPLAFYGGLWIIFWGVLFHLDFLRDDFGIILGFLNIFLYVVPTLIFTIIYEKRLASTSKNFFLFSLYQSAVFGFVSVFSVVLADLERPAQLLLFFLKFPLHIITSKDSPIVRTAACLALSLIVYFLIRKKTVNKNVGIALLYTALLVYDTLIYAYPAMLRTEFEDFYNVVFVIGTSLLLPLAAILLVRKETDLKKKRSFLIVAGVSAFSAQLIKNIISILFNILHYPNNPVNVAYTISYLLRPPLRLAVFTVLLVGLHAFTNEIRAAVEKLDKKKINLGIAVLIAVALIFLIYPLVSQLIKYGAAILTNSSFIMQQIKQLAFVTPVASFIYLASKSVKKEAKTQQNQA